MNGTQFKLDWLPNEQLKAMPKEQLNNYVYEQCRKQYAAIGAVLPPIVCVSCKGCPIKTLVIGISKLF